jgi:hypothetical protein
MLGPDRLLACQIRHVSLLPLDLCVLEQGKIIFERRALEVVKGQITLHRLPKILNGSTKLACGQSLVMVIFRPHLSIE